MSTPSVTALDVKMDTEKEYDEEAGPEPTEKRLPFEVNGESKFHDPDGNVILISKDKFEFRLHDYVLKTLSNTFLDILTMPAKDYGPVTEIQLDERAEDLCRWFSLIIELEVNIRPDPSIKPDTSIDKKRADDKRRAGEFKTLLGLIDKYQSEMHIKLFKATFDTFITTTSSNPLELFIIACQRGWEDSAKASLKRFSTWSFIKSHGPSFLPEHLPQSEIRKLGLESFGSYVRACNGCRNGATVDWVKASKQLSLKEPEFGDCRTSTTAVITAVSPTNA